MKKIILLTTVMLFTAFTLFCQPKQEIRAVWLTTNGGSDWPAGKYTESVQKTNMIAMLDKLQAANFNTIILQVQVKGDVAWKSDIQPAMYDITGNGSKDLSWDVCRFIIDECHKRNMECHAWIVTYRIGTTSEAKRYSSNRCKHVTVLHPELCVSYSGAWYLDPGLPEVRSYLVNLYKEMITNYDFDGTNFDYTRYPDSGFDDAASYAKYGNGMNKDDWRRQNINTFVHEFYDMAKSVRPTIKVGAAPIGTYKNVAGYGNMTAYGDVYQDACEWMQSGKQDLLVPQMYWNEKYGFSPNMTTWVTNSAGRQLVVGLAPYKMLDSNNWDESVIADQIEKVRAKAGMSGVCFFRTDNVIGSQAKVVQLYNDLKDNYFKYPANIVPMDYNGITKPNAPINSQISYANETYSLSWDIPNLDEKSTPIKYYCVYASESTPVDITKVENCVGFYVKDNNFEYASKNPNLKFAITTFDSNYYESDVAVPSGVDAITTNGTSFEISGDNLLVHSSKEIISLEIFSISGARVAFSASNEANIGILNKGVYLLKATNSDGSFYKDKFIR